MSGRLALVHLLALLALCAGFLLLGESEPGREVAAKAPDALAAFEADRARTRTQLMEALADLRSDPDEAIQREAAALLLELVRRTDAETTMEGILRARGHRDACVSVRPGSVNILVRGEITAAQAAAILELALRETGETPGSVKIVPIA